MRYFLFIDVSGVFSVCVFVCVGECVCGGESLEL